MITLEGAGLKVMVLDPVVDEAKLGTRYCTGGFIYQVEDARLGALLAGPTYPDSYNLFDGQGAPDAFQPHLGSERGSLTLGIGIGVIDTAAGVTVSRCAWTIERASASIRFVTRQQHEAWGLELERTLVLAGRTLREETRLANTGKAFVPFQWYPHPFYPLVDSGECCRFSVPVTLPENPGYALGSSGFIRMKDLPWDQRGHFQLLGHPGSHPLAIVQRHPAAGLVAAWTDYVPGRLPIWGNRCTFSFEPYYERVLGPGAEARWSISYAF